MNEKELLGMLRDFKEVLDKHGVEFWLDKGTLLGAVREGKIIDTDDDIDISTWMDNITEKVDDITDELYSKGYDVYIGDTKIQIRKGELHATLWFFDVKKDYVVRDSYVHIGHFLIGNILTYVVIAGLTTIGKDKIHKMGIKMYIIQYIKNKLMNLRPNVKKTIVFIIRELSPIINCLDYYVIKIPVSYCSELKQIDFYDMKVNIFKNPEKYLVYLYKDWKTPRIWKTPSISKWVKQNESWK